MYSLSKCSCGYSTVCRDEFCHHLAESWNDLRIEHHIKLLDQ